MPDIRAVIFDMDGLLVDTEPIWRRVEIETFGELGFALTEEEALQTMGIRIDDIVQMYYNRRPWTGPSVTDVTRSIQQGVIDHVLNEGEPLPGVCEALAMVHERGMPIAIASSSSERMIEAVVRRLKIGRFISATASGEHEPEGKPHPGVYRSAARRLGVAPAECLALEDSPNGVLSAKAAGMVCVAVPDRYMAEDPRMAEADVTLTSLEEFTPSLLDALLGLPASA